VSPLSGSLDPVSFAAALSRIPQIHYIGGADSIVPQSVVESYRAALGPAAPVRLVVMPGFTHECCWEAAWPRLIARARREERTAE
jgi:pimeloyl-ACP methyl ester carboxylesterase